MCKSTRRSQQGQYKRKHPTFAECDHPLLVEWDYDLNAQEGNYPDNATPGSSKCIWWMCRQCHKGHKHSWQATCTCRTTHATGCPFCSHRRLCVCNSLQIVYPELAADFDSKANGITPDQVMANSTTRYKWLSDALGAPLRSVNQHSQTLRNKLRRAGQL